ncbi:hypothetical protein CC117_28655 [Parafrankia colletiae]|uniref:Uncharacterized protein n=1 Tax=Parafrankia colletiae TaxID=573497 RepID=A0A1S1Q8G1_9ACTN|nr:hypothetical protein CC117_28655 [Parafrankia colletiae]
MLPVRIRDVVGTIIASGLRITGAWSAYPDRVLPRVRSRRDNATEVRPVSGWRQGESMNGRRDSL